MGKKKSLTDLTRTELKSLLAEDYERWKRIYTEGTSDPSYSDGINANLIRNHIIYHKYLCEANLKDKWGAYPDEYYFPEPPELLNSFMAKDRYLPLLNEVLKKSDKAPYKDVIKFDWREAFE